MAMWKDENPWGDRAVEVPADELAEALTGNHTDGARLLGSWVRLGNAIDAYLLTQPDGEIKAGVRYGSEPGAYLSPHVPDRERLADLFARHVASGPRP